MSETTIATNRQARFNYFISDTAEAGVVLTGNEVKSIREGNVSIKDGYVRFTNGEAFVVGMHIGPYSHSENTVPYDPTQTRKLLLHKNELLRLMGKINEKGCTCIPLSLYFKRGLVKLSIGIGKGKKLHDKRETLKKKVHDREMRQSLKNRTK
ncbi:MAG: SsrA-binding protein [Omnitrophica bacterium RIFCSPLOWO2_12_FULL_44_17]|uniref:SsrA-binding protein n=1 Tax=Candidatus Danuiimicrobium aquiferis TaxID=1801832 RepID=A0A1G1KRF9_9BACT|nr:MAG: SsrA-binding protein [Omnitrophica bacterium RIFCSPHIGHO2_12_FULL_44_12]OGW95521.1 MAG: SsrA-binding protein [Omnitrophica bacterium RIFCSPLOWO2_12_FULL_44_17]OGX01613.1 MAG: SsrA-binding protein [Omnitrophica bacterium RIFCSPLOWO2_02_FULL_44_11]